MDIPKILIVDDDELVRTMLREFFTRKGYGVEVKKNGEEALDAMKSNIFDLAMVDIKMPGMDGITLMSRIKQISENLPVIIITGYPDMNNILSALKGGAFDFKRKPINLDGLLFTVEEAVRKIRLIRENKSLVDELRETNQNLQRMLTEKTESLTREKSRLESMIDGMKEAVVFCDENDRIVDINKYALDLFNVKKEDAVGKDIYLHHKKESYPKVRYVLDTFKNHREQNYMEWDRYIADRWFNLRFSAVRDHNGKYLGTILNLIDITDRKLVQMQMVRVEKLASIGGLTAGMAHEILNPLNIISGNIQIKLTEKDITAEERRMYEVMQKQVERIVNIIDGLERFSKQREPKKEEIDIHILIEKVLSLLDYDFKLQNIGVGKAFDKGIPSVIGDADQLEQVLMIILTNARDALNERELKEDAEKLERMRWKKKINIITMGCGLSPHVLSGGQRGDVLPGNGKYLAIAVSDTGGGIPERIISRIFDPFFTTKQEGKGTGLGLSIAHGIMEALGGRIKVESEIGKGTTFTILLPC
ncbi:MAG: response regulator [Nitrospinae bacterium]|nr:response regulator [Nitrospinota bacterium]MBI3814617.1 response regulator [Nitrospinota bacterium]